MSVASVESAVVASEVVEAAVVGTVVSSLVGASVVTLSWAGGGGQTSASKGSDGGLQPSTCIVAVMEGCMTVLVTMALVKVTISYFTGRTTGMLNGRMPVGDLVRVYKRR